MNRRDALAEAIELLDAARRQLVEKDQLIADLREEIDALKVRLRERPSWAPIDRLPTWLLLQIRERHGMSSADLTDARRDAPRIAARKDACRLLRDAGWSLKSIGRAMKRDHTTVLHHLGGTAK